MHRTNQLIIRDTPEQFREAARQVLEEADKAGQKVFPASGQPIEIHPEVLRRMGYKDGQRLTLLPFLELGRHVGEYIMERNAELTYKKLMEKVKA